MRKVVGLDISLQKTAVRVLDRDGQLVWQGKIDSEPGPLIEKLRTWQDQGLRMRFRVDYARASLATQPGA